MAHFPPHPHPSRPHFNSQAGQHHGRAHKLALEPGSPHCFLSSGEDGVVRHFDLREPSYGNRKLLGLSMPNSLWSSQLEIYALAINPTRPWQLALSCADEKVKVYDFRCGGGVLPHDGLRARHTAPIGSVCLLYPVSGGSLPSPIRTLHKLRNLRKLYYHC